MYNYTKKLVTAPPPTQKHLILLCNFHLSGDFTDVICEKKGYDKVTKWWW